MDHNKEHLKHILIDAFTFAVKAYHDIRNGIEHDHLVFMGNFTLAATNLSLAKSLYFSNNLLSSQDQEMDNFIFQFDNFLKFFIQDIEKKNTFSLAILEFDKLNEAFEEIAPFLNKNHIG